MGAPGPDPGARTGSRASAHGAECLGWGTSRDGVPLRAEAGLARVPENPHTGDGGIHMLHSPVSLRPGWLATGALAGILAVCALPLGLVSGGTASAAEVPSHASEVCSIPIGSSVPAVTVRDLDGNETDLHSLVTEQPTILIFYRGGW